MSIADTAKKIGIPVPKRISWNHTVPTRYIRPNHPINITLIGCGGTGSQLLVRLAAINYSLIALNHPGITVTVYDPDSFSEFNVGRQSCYPSDIGRNKAEVMISRINRTYGFVWIAKGIYWDGKASDIVITAVDSYKPRLAVSKATDWSYWMDIGNSKDYGQIILGSKAIPQPNKEGVMRLSTVMDLHPDLKAHDKPNEPSCSMAEALGRQDLCINAMMATWAQKILWAMFHEYRIDYHGVYVNLKTMTTNPIRVAPIPQTKVK